MSLLILFILQTENDTNDVVLAEDVVVDEEAEDTGPTPVIFLSYQWGYQQEVKLLKRHLEMAGYPWYI